MFSLEFQVRDYECDMQGIVNNAVYLNYFEHTRHEYLKYKGYDFFEITQSGINLVVYKTELDYLLPLKSGNQFHINLEMERLSKTRCVFNQTIVIENKIYTKAKFFVAGTNSQAKPINLDKINIDNLI